MHARDDERVRRDGERHIAARVREMALGRARGRCAENNHHLVLPERVAERVAGRALARLERRHFVDTHARERALELGNKWRERLELRVAHLLQRHDEQIVAVALGDERAER